MNRYFAIVLLIGLSACVTPHHKRSARQSPKPEEPVKQADDPSKKDFALCAPESVPFYDDSDRENGRLHYEFPVGCETEGKLYSPVPPPPPPTPDPEFIYPIAAPKEAGDIRMATWNLQDFTHTKATGPITTSDGTTLLRAELVKQVIVDYEIDIIGLQEVLRRNYSRRLHEDDSGKPGAEVPGTVIHTVEPDPSRGTDHAIHLAVPSGYKLLLGGEVLAGGRTLPRPKHLTRGPNAGQWKVYSGALEEYCPIIFNEATLDCSYADSTRRLYDASATPLPEKKRSLHYVLCSLAGQPMRGRAAPSETHSFDFVYACSHLDTETSILKENITHLGEFQRSMSGREPDVILGGDFNSHPLGMGRRHWGIAVPGLDLRPEVSLMAGVDTTKIKPGRPDEPGKPGPPASAPIPKRRTIDDLLWPAASTTEDAKPGTKKIIPVMHQHFSVEGVEQLDDYIQLSDHIPVMADFLKDNDTD
ncbi:MAG: endonuclease/exonuclease/phosphatase family protein [bacterium]